MAGLIGRKLGMTRLFADDGSVVPVSVIEAAPNTVTRIRSVEQDGYAAVQIGAGRRAVRRSQVAGQFKHLPKDQQHPKAVREVRVDETDAYEVGQQIGVDLFEAGELVDVTGVSKGHGFTGVIARHNFRRGPKTHGSTTTALRARSAPGRIPVGSGRARRWPATWATSG
jgi:large subunit ribosomal protein L3